MRAKAIAEMMAANEEVKKEAVEKIDKIKSDDAQIEAIEKADNDLAKKSEKDEKVAAKVKEAKDVAAQNAPPPELEKAITKEAEQKSGVRI